MLLRTTLLAHMPGMKLIDVSDAEINALEDLMRDFILRDLCPNLVKEEFADSQEAEEEKEEDSAMLNADNPAKVDLHIEAEPIPEVYEQAE